MIYLVRNYSLKRSAAQVSAAFRTGLSVLVLVKVFVDATLAKGAQALINRVRVSEETIAQWALEKLMEISLFYSSDEGGLSLRT